MDLLLPALFALVHAAARPPDAPVPPVLLVAAEDNGGVRRIPITKAPVDKQPSTPEPKPPKGEGVPKLPPSSVPSPPPPAPPPQGGGAKGPDNSQCKRGTGQTGWDGCR